MTKFVNINPTTAENKPTEFQNEFAALVNVQSSRFDKHSYNPESGLEPKVGIKWVMGTTKGNTFERTWSTGLGWEEFKSAISPDGKSISVAIKKNSDAAYMLSRAIDAGFPSDRVSNDVSVFEKETFLVTTQVNPNSKGSAKKPYPKKYHAEGWEAAKAEALARQAAKAAQQNAPVYGTDTKATMIGSYTPPTNIQGTDVNVVAADALTDILKNTKTGAVSRMELPKLLNQYVERNKIVWAPEYRQQVGVALWDMESLKTVVGSNPALKLDGETISFSK